MKPVHILAKPGSVSDRVLIAGDPGRVKKLSSLLKGPRLVNDNRGFLVYTGRYNGERITLATHGIGGPSAAIVVEELAMLGAKTFIRYGSSGALSPKVSPGEFVIPTMASHEAGGLYRQYFGTRDRTSSAVPEERLRQRLAMSFAKHGLTYHTGKIYSTDAFYAEDHSMVRRLSRMGNIAVEMECALLFKLSKLRGWKSASALIVSDTLVGGGKAWLSQKEIEAKAMEGAEAVLDALV